MFIVLFVDNDATIRIIAKNALESHWDCKLLSAVSGPEGVKVALKERPKLILLDVIMPGMDGVATLKKLREEGVDAPVIFVTAKTDAQELMQHADLNVISVITKPFIPRTLLEHCCKVLGEPTK